MTKDKMVEEWLLELSEKTESEGKPDCRFVGEKQANRNT